MPRRNFDQLVSYATSEGYLNFGQHGGLMLDETRNDGVSKQLKNYFHVIENGTIEEQFANWHGNLKEDEIYQFAQRTKQARRAAAKVAMERGWHNMGGPAAPVGLPWDGQIVIKEQGLLGLDGYTAQFRGGTLNLPSDGSQIVSKTRRVVNVDLVGIECQIRQEKTDEVYGVISVLGPSSSTIHSRRFPESGTINMGPTGMRISNINVPLVSNGVLQDYYIWASLVENDSGDVDVVARNITDRFAQVAGQLVGGLTGAPAEAVSSSESFKENLATGLAWVFGNILGMGDDAYNAESFKLFWGDLAHDAPPTMPPVRRNDDPRSINQWTHSLTLSGIDDGGDPGQYALYFNVWMAELTDTIIKSTKP